MSIDARLACAGRVPRGVLLTLAAAAALGTVSQAWAQEDVQRQSVANRARPAFDAPPVAAGGLLLSPSASATIAYDDNIYARDDVKVSDGTLVLAPRIDVDTGPGLVTARATLSSEHTRYLDESRENHDDYRAALALDYGRGTATRLFADIDFRRQSENRTAIDSLRDVAVRGRFSRFAASGGITREAGPVYARLEARTLRLDYSNVIDSSGAVRDYAARDFWRHGVSGRLGYSRGGRLRLFVSAEYERKLYDLRAGKPGFDAATMTDRSAEGYRLEAGIGYQITSVLFVEARAGYLDYRFDDARLNDVSGPAFDVELLWNATPLTSVTLRARREVDERASTEFAGNRRTSASLRVDHELLRNLVVSIDGLVAENAPVGGLEKSTRRGLGAAAEYRAGRHLRLGVFARHDKRSSVNPALDFARTMVGVSTRYDF